MVEISLSGNGVRSITGLMGSTSLWGARRFASCPIRAVFGFGLRWMQGYSP